MAEWNPKSLTKMILFFLIFLLLFNTGGYLYGSSTVSIPFSPTNRGYISKLLKYSIGNLPITIESYPPISKPTFLSLWCGDDLPLSEQHINLKKKYNLGILSLCEPETLDVYPKTNNSGLWIHSMHPSANIIMLFSRILFISLLTLTYYVLFKNGKNFSSLRSSLISCLGCIFIIDPLNIFSPIIPAIKYFHMIITCFGWWRTSAEIFSEYAPLVQMSSNFYKKITAIPTIFIIFGYISSFIGKSFSNSEALIFIGLGIAILPVTAVWFIIKAGNTTGRVTLMVHVISGVGAMSIIYLSKMVKLLMNDESHDMFMFTTEISFAGAYALFHTLIEVGESKSNSGLSSQAVRRYDKIDELLDTLGNIGDEVRFGIEEEEDKANDEVTEPEEEIV